MRRGENYEELERDSMAGKSIVCVGKFKDDPETR
jgi:hypothetical protein